MNYLSRHSRNIKQMLKFFVQFLILMIGLSKLLIHFFVFLFLLKPIHSLRFVNFICYFEFILVDDFVQSDFDEKSCDFFRLSLHHVKVLFKNLFRFQLVQILSIESVSHLLLVYFFNFTQFLIDFLFLLL